MLHYTAVRKIIMIEMHSQLLGNGDVEHFLILCWTVTPS
jgi:hypothetical protein